MKVVTFHRDERLTVRFTDSELKAIRRAARWAHVHAGTWVRRVALEAVRRDESPGRLRESDTTSGA